MLSLGEVLHLYRREISSELRPEDLNEIIHLIDLVLDARPIFGMISRK
jgi:hypothetical protein